MERKCLSREASRVEKILGIGLGSFRRDFPGLSWTDHEFCRELDMCSYDFADIYKRFRKLINPMTEDNLKDPQINELFHVIGFLFSLSLFLEENLEKYITRFIKFTEFAEFAPNEFKKWVEERKKSARHNTTYI